MDLTSIFLRLLLENPTGSLEAWSNIKKSYLKGFDSVILAIGSYYTKHGTLPNFSELKVVNRNMSVNTSLATLVEVEIPDDITIDIVADALLDTYTQDTALESIDGLLDNITLLDSHEIKESLANISIALEEHTHSSADVVNMLDLSIITEPEQREAVVDLLFSEEFDKHSGGLSETNLILVGGYRGSGKSILACNLAVEQYKAGNVGVVFSIEMPATEIFHRYMSMLAGVKHSDIKNSTLNEIQKLKLAKARSGMFTEGAEHLEEYTEHGDFAKLEQRLHSCDLKHDNQLIIIDNPSITLTQIDLHLYKLKARFGERLKLVTVDYLNVIAVPENEGQFDWKQQLQLSKGLKTLAGKHEVLIVAPMQTQENGQVKYSKDILISPDVVFNMSVEGDHMEFKTIKTRNIAPIEFRIGIDWNTLQICPTQIAKPVSESDSESEGMPAASGDDL